MSSGPQDFHFTESEKDLIILGVSEIRRTVNGVITTYSINSFGPSSFVYNLIRERLGNNASLDIKALYNANATILQSAYPQVYQLYTSASNIPQTITATTTYTTV